MQRIQPKNAGDKFSSRFCLIVRERILQRVAQRSEVCGGVRVLFIESICTVRSSVSFLLTESGRKVVAQQHPVEVKFARL